jgi:hypothetical protein
MTGKKTLEKPGLFKSFSENSIHPSHANCLPRLPGRHPRQAAGLMILHIKICYNILTKSRIRVHDPTSGSGVVSTEACSRVPSTGFHQQDSSVRKYNPEP